MNFPRARILRLLPSVMLVCGGLLVLKATGIVHDAYALENALPGADAMGAAPKPINKDYADDDGQIASAAEVNVLTSLTKRRGELDAREAQIRIQSNMLAATEARVDTKITQLKTLQGQITALLAQRDADQDKQVASLVKTYSTMKAKDAARIFDSLADNVLVPVAKDMKSDILAPILAAMNPDNAQKLTLKLANKLALPDTTQALTPVAPPPAPAASAVPTPGPVAQATPPAAAPAAAPATPAATPASAPAAKPATPAKTPAPAAAAAPATAPKPAG